jgi:ankyrin repeat protein
MAGAAAAQPRLSLAQPNHHAAAAGAVADVESESLTDTSAGAAGGRADCRADDADASSAARHHGQTGDAAPTVGASVAVADRSSPTAAGDQGSNHNIDSDKGGGPGRWVDYEAHRDHAHELYFKAKATRTAFPLHAACAAGDANAVRALLQPTTALGGAASASIDELDAVGRPAVRYACGAGHDEVLRVLIEHKVNLHLFDAATGTTPLMMAARGGFLSTVRLLLAANADVAVRDRKDETALIKALVFAERQFREVAALLQDEEKAHRAAPKQPPPSQRGAEETKRAAVLTDRSRSAFETSRSAASSTARSGGDRTSRSTATGGGTSRSTGGDRTSRTSGSATARKDAAAAAAAAAATAAEATVARTAAATEAAAAPSQVKQVASTAAVADLAPVEPGAGGGPGAAAAGAGAGDAAPGDPAASGGGA